MAIRVKITGAGEFSRLIKCLIVGEAGSGKTLTASTWPNPLYADADGGLMSVAHMQLPSVEITSSADMKELRRELDRPADEREKVWRRPIDTLVIDTFDAWQAILIKERLRATKKDAFVIQDWGWLTETCKAIVHGFRNLPLNVVFLCHLREENDEEEGRSHRPALQGGIREAITGYMDLDVIIRSRLVSKVTDNKTEKVMERVLLTRPTKLAPWLKDRTGKLPAEFPINFEDDYKRLSETMFSGIGALPETAEYDLDRPAAPDPVPEAVAEVPTPQPVEARVAAVKAKSAPSNPLRNAVQDAPAHVDPETGEILESQAGVMFPITAADTAVAAQEAGPAEEVCAECGGEVSGLDLKISKIRYREALCKPHFQARQPKAA